MRVEFTMFLFEFISELDIFLQDLIIYCKKYIRRHRVFNYKRFSRRTTILVKKKLSERWALYQFVGLTFILLRKRFITQHSTLRFLRKSLKYLIYIKRYYKQFYISIFLLNIFNKEYYQSHFSDFSRELSSLFLRFLLQYLTEFELKYIQANIKFYKKRSRYLFFRFLRSLRFKVFFIFFYIFNLFNIIVLRNFIINTPLDASLPTDRGEYYHGVRRFGFFPRIFWTFMETVMIHVRPYRKYIDTFNLMCLNLRGLHGMFYYYIIIDFINSLKFLVRLATKFLLWFKTIPVFIINGILGSTSFKFYYYSYVCIFDWVLYFFSRLFQQLNVVLVNCMLFPLRPVFYFIQRSITIFPFLFFLQYIEIFIKFIAKVFVKLFVIFVSLLVGGVLLYFGILKFILIGIFLYYLFYYIWLIRGLKYLESFFIRFSGSTLLSSFYLSFYYNLLNELKHVYQLPDPIYQFFVSRIQDSFYMREKNLLNLEMVKFFNLNLDLAPTRLENFSSLLLNNLKLVQCSRLRYLWLLVYLSLLFRLFNSKKINFETMHCLVDEGFRVYGEFIDIERSALGFQQFKNKGVGSLLYMIDYNRCNSFLRRRNYKSILRFNDFELLYIIIRFYVAEQEGDFFYSKAGLKCFNQKKLK